MPVHGPILKKRELEMKLQGLESLSRPSPKLEQYPTPVSIASDILFTAKVLGDIDGKEILDLGCGNGIFSIGAALMGSRKVTGIDVDPQAVHISKTNATNLGLDIEFHEMDVADVDLKADVVIQNPPFGSQNKHADRPFLQKAMESANVVYTIHMAETADFIERTASENGFAIDVMKDHEFEIRHTFKFHTREKKMFIVTMFRLIKGDGR